MGRDVIPWIRSKTTADFNPLSPHGERPTVFASIRPAAYFNPLSPHGERRLFPRSHRQRAFRFQSTLPAWGETGGRLASDPRDHISIHSPRMGRDNRNLFQRQRQAHFNPLSPHGERLFPHTQSPSQCPFQSTLPAWGETKGQHGLTMSDCISIHSPRMGRDRAHVDVRQRKLVFQSTLPAWGETNSQEEQRRSFHHFNPLSPHGERLVTGTRTRKAMYFNPLSPHGERPITTARKYHSINFNPLSPHGERLCHTSIYLISTDFNPLSPHGERPVADVLDVLELYISIHSPRMGRDPPASTYLQPSPNFNPLSPHGERPKRSFTPTTARTFQSTLPAWGETLQICFVVMDQKISIHSPRMGRDTQGSTLTRRSHNFNPLSPHGERLNSLKLQGNTQYISIHSPRMGRDKDGRFPIMLDKDFNPLSPHGERPPPPAGGNGLKDFNPLSPHGERPALYVRSCETLLFQSTLPAWGETTSSAAFSFAAVFQSTLPAWGETAPITIGTSGAEISIHSPRMGRDNTSAPQAAHGGDFNPLSPHGERLGRAFKICPDGLISIHSPRMGRDIPCCAAVLILFVFQSTLPAWGETRRLQCCFQALKFQSTLPAWGETRAPRIDFPAIVISIHSPRMGRDGRLAFMP